MVFGRGSVRSGDGPGQPVAAGQVMFWTAGEEHTTRADADLTGYVLEAAGLFG